MAAESLTCPQCNAPLEPPPGRTQFFCQFCSATVVIPERMQTPVESENPRDDQPLRPAPDLSKFEIDRRGDYLEISWSWRSWVVLFLIPFAIFWNGITWTVGGAFLFAGFGGFGHGGGFALLGSLIALPHFCIGLFLIYLIVAMLCNRTAILVDHESISVKHGPIPWKAPKPIDRRQVEQLYVTETINHGKNGSSANYSLMALLKDGRKVALLKNQTDENTPQAVERMIEVHLNIEDRRVHGEHA